MSFVQKRAAFRFLRDNLHVELYLKRQSERDTKSNRFVFVRNARLARSILEDLLVETSKINVHIFRGTTKEP